MPCLFYSSTVYTSAECAPACWRELEFCIGFFMTTCARVVDGALPLATPGIRVLDLAVAIEI